MINFIESSFDQPIVAVGHSFGGILTYMSACTRPSLFKAVIMLDPPLVHGMERHIFKFAKKNALINIITPAKKAQNRNREWPQEHDLVAYFASKALFKNMDIECIEDYVSSVIENRDGKKVLSFDPSIEAKIFRTIPDNLNRFAGKLKTPTMLMTAMDSKVCNPSFYGPFLRHNPIIKHKVFPKGGHMFPLERPDALAEAIKKIIPSLIGEN